MPKPNSSLWVDLLDIEKFISVNALSEVTSPIYVDKRSFHPKGVLSQEIFGTSNYDRRNRFAYIDLHGHYMYPLAALKLSSYDRRLADALYSRGRYKLVDGALVEDEDGDSGPEFVYKIWGKVKIKEKTTETTKEVQKFFERPREKLFITKFPVIPPFYRDVNISDVSNSKSSNVINSQYSSIISYTQSMSTYTDTLGNMTRLTQARVQTLLVDIYKDLMVKQVKGQPSKFGMLRRSLAGKNLPYTARLVITAANLNKESLNQIQTRFGYATIPLQYVCTLFMPFMIHDLKAYFDAQFIQGGKYPIKGPDGEMTYTTFTESYDEQEISGMITKFVNSPNTRFDVVKTPRDVNGNQYDMVLTGRFNKDNTTFSRPATYTDILYIVAERMARNKHVFLTRYPLDNPNGQFPARIIVSTTTETVPVTIGENVYEHYPVIKGDPLNAFMTTGQMSNTMCEGMNADYDGDQCSVKGCWTKESNEEAERQIMSNSYIVSVQGKSIRSMTKDFVITQYCLTHLMDGTTLEDINKVKPKYAI